MVSLNLKILKANEIDVLLFYDKLARHMQDNNIIVEPDSREPLFMCEAHDQSCLADTLRAFETSVDLTLEQVEEERRAS